jgi:hypothetical protein
MIPEGRLGGARPLASVVDDEVGEALELLWGAAAVNTTFPAEVIGESGIAFGAPPVVARAHHGRCPERFFWHRGKRSVESAVATS